MHKCSAFKNEAKKEKCYLLYFLIRLYLETDTEMVFLAIGVSKKRKRNRKEAKTHYHYLGSVT